ncbi:hypothetical protein LTR49_024389 [Elasticomyces elasticus]|nr:hypothetical protein LTR49_024389 [Elasticomyces elasticus]KAK5745077.1 hypothetical protein LTS12_023231 [Elasticomyces elasticus]
MRVIADRVYDMEWRDRANGITHGRAIAYGIVKLPDIVSSLDILPKPRRQYMTKAIYVVDEATILIEQCQKP